MVGKTDEGLSEDDVPGGAVWHVATLPGAVSLGQMEIIAALFMDDIQLRSVPGPSTRIDLSGIQDFSAPAPAPVPVSVGPHLVVIVWAHPAENGFARLRWCSGH
ncbi:MAG: hypothetical protein R2706_17865 [Acidimicrobiales bacterium]